MRCKRTPARHLTALTRHNHARLLFIPRPRVSVSCCRGRRPKGNHLIDQHRGTSCSCGSLGRLPFPSPRNKHSLPPAMSFKKDEEAGEMGTSPRILHEKVDYPHVPTSSAHNSLLPRQVHGHPGSSRVQRISHLSTQMSRAVDSDSVPAVCRRDVHYTGSHDAVLRSDKVVPAQGRELKTAVSH
jgi:hypothetical protein